MLRIFKPVCLMVVLTLVLSLGVFVFPTGVAIGNGVTVDFEADVTEGDAPLTVCFESTVSGYCEYPYYCWDFGDGGESDEENPCHTYTEPGTYTVSLEIWCYYVEGSEYIANQGADAEMVKKMFIHVCDPVEAGFSAEPRMGEAPHTVQFRDGSTGDVEEWLWNFGDGETSTSRSPEHTYQNEGMYTVSLEVTSECGGTSELSRTDYIMVEAGGAPPMLVVRDLNINPVYAEPRQEIGITAKVVNEGGAWGSAEMQLLINGQFEQSVPVGVAPGTAQPISFTVYKTEAREYQVAIGDAMATFYVMEEAKEASSGYGPLDTGGIIAIVVIAVILVGGVVVVFLLAQRPS